MQRCVLIGMNSFVMTIVTVELRRRRRRRPRTRARYRCLGCRPGTGVMWNILGNFIDFRSEASPTVKPRNVGLFPHSTNDTSPDDDGRWVVPPALVVLPKHKQKYQRLIE
eukprot:scaffold2005_cov202-Alexandrium_tamarense.AAC.1